MSVDSNLPAVIILWLHNMVIYKQTHKSHEVLLLPVTNSNELIHTAVNYLQVRWQQVMYYRC